jgi:dipeptidase E
MKQLFLTSSGDKVLADIVKKLPKNPGEYNVAFINTAAESKSGDHPWVRDEKNKLVELGFMVDEFSITKMETKEIESNLKNKQIIYFTGGSTFYLMDKLIKTGCDEIIKKMSDEIIFIGSSAGAKIFGERIDLCTKIDDGIKPSEIRKDGLKMIDFTIMPHWGSEHFKERYQDGFEQIYTEGLKMIPITNQQYIWVNNDSIKIIQV